METKLNIDAIPDGSIGKDKFTDEIKNSIDNSILPDNLKTINGESIIGEGDIDLSGYATKEDLSDKQDTLISGNNIKTVNGLSLVGPGNIDLATLSGSSSADAAPSGSSLNFSTTEDSVVLEGYTIGGEEILVPIPTATTDKAGAMSAEDKKEQVKKTPLINGDIIVGQAREVYSRQGKVDTATFLKRTTAGGTSVSDGVASVKQIGGNIVKNLVDGTFSNEEVLTGTYEVISDRNICKLFNDKPSYAQIRTKTNATSVVGHKYYSTVLVYNEDAAKVQLSISGGYRYSVYLTTKKEWGRLSSYGTQEDVEVKEIIIRGTYEEGKTSCTVYLSNWLAVDLTEMYGAGNEPSKEECDKLFATIGALPNGLSFAQPTAFKSIGYNHWNPANVLEYKSVSAGTIIGVSGSHIAIIECLPCKTGTGENNGYVIGYGEGDTWSDEGIEVYLSPLNPLEVEGELYMQKLEKDATYGTYVPQIKGYLLVVTPTIDKLCAHFLWSGDRAKTDYEEYVESNVTLPTIPEMSEWGLAGISSSGTTVQDTIDLENMVYTKRLTKLKLNNALWTYYPANDTSYPYGFFVTTITGIRMSKEKNIFASKKYTVGNFNVDKSVFGNVTSGGKTIYIVDSEFNDREALNANLADVDFYVEITPEEYPILTKAAPNYIGSDYGVEEFTGSKIPLAANILFYMRSLVGETRNFIDQLYTNTQKTDAKEVANYITNGIEENKQLAAEAPNLALRALYITAGAEYNDSGADKTKTAPWGETVTHKAGHYYLNGLGDITETQMRYIYNRGYFNDNDKAPLGYSATGRANAIRTNLSRVGMWNAKLQSYLCINNKTIEVVNLHTIRGTETDACTISFADTESIFADSSKLSVVDVRCLLSGNWLSSSFKNCSSLREIRVRYLKNDIIFAQSPLLSKATVLYMIQNATPTSAITITLHPDAYTRLAEDADIVAALNEKNGYIDEEGDEIAGTLPAGASINLVSA